MSEQLSQMPPRIRGTLDLVGALAWLALLGGMPNLVFRW